MQDWNTELKITTRNENPFLGNGIRSYGAITILGYEQALEITKKQSVFLGEEVLLFGELADGSFIGLFNSRVVFINQMEPEYEKGWRESSVRSPFTLQEFNDALEKDSSLLPTDYWAAFERFSKPV